MSFEYEGPAQVQINDTEPIDVYADLAITVSGGWKQWGGQLSFDDEHRAALFAMPDIAITIPDEGEGRAVVTSSSPEENTVEIQGTGPAPWGF